MTPFNSIYRSEIKKKDRDKLIRDARCRLALYCDHAKEIHCIDGEMVTNPVCGALFMVLMISEIFG